jgi:hypothetical protein
MTEDVAGIEELAAPLATVMYVPFITQVSDLQNRKARAKTYGYNVAQAAVL